MVLNTIRQWFNINDNWQIEFELFHALPPTINYRVLNTDNAQALQPGFVNNWPIIEPLTLRTYDWQRSVILAPRVTPALIGVPAWNTIAARGSSHLMDNAGAGFAHRVPPGRDVRVDYRKLSAFFTGQHKRARIERPSEN